MPKKYGRKSKVPKKSYKKTKAKSALKGADTHTVFIKTSALLTPQQGLVSSNYVYSYFSPSPDYLSPSQAVPLFGLPEFTLWRNIYDKFRVMGLGIAVKPRYNVSEMSQLINRQDSAATGSQTEGNGVCYSTIDVNGMAPSSIPQLKKYPTTQVHKITSTWKRGYNIKYPNNIWLDTRNPAGGSDLMTELGMRGGITVSGFSFPEIRNNLTNTPWADVEITYKIVFKSKTMCGMTQTSLGGSLFALTLTPHDAAVNLDPTPVYQITDDNPLVGQIDISGNMILPV